MSRGTGYHAPIGGSERYESAYGPDNGQRLQYATITEQTLA
jgi:hypothetical protein